MGNRLCKRRGNDGETAEVKENAVDRIMSRLCLRPNSWTTDLHRSKQVSRSSKSKLFKDDSSVKPFSKSTDWIEASLEVPDKDISMSFENSKLEPIFSDSTAGTPVPPPRKQKKGIKEKIEQAAKSGLLALQPKKSIEEPLCIKKKIDYSCPCHDPKHKHNIISNHSVEENNIVNKKELKLEKSKKTDKEKESKRRKNLSVVSLPNFNELRFTIAHFGDIDATPSKNNQIKGSNVSLPQDAKMSGSKSYMVRCRSFGSLLPQQLLEKLKPTPSKAPSAESDDSFGPLEDWDLDLIEHYNPRDASLPRPRRTVPKTEKKILSNIENQVMTEDIDSLPESPEKLLSSNSTETLLLSDTFPTLESKNSTPSNFHIGPPSFSSLEMYDSIEDYTNNSKNPYKDESSSSKSDISSPPNDKEYKGAVVEKKPIHNIVEQFIESEKKCGNIS